MMSSVFPLSCRSVFAADSLSRLEDLFKCRICYDTFTDPATAKCGHNFCAICIRRYLISYKQQCPECYEPIYDSDLRPNRILDDIFKLLVDVVMPSVKLPKGGDKQIEIKVYPPVVEVEARVRNETKLEKKEDSISSDDVMASTSQDARIDCPVCGVSIPERNVNLHLDNCLKEQRGDVKKPKKVRQNKMKPLKKLVYHLVKESELRKLLKEKGLETKGDKASLIARHQRFAAIWNTECEKETPLSPLEIVMEVQKAEAAEKRKDQNSDKKSSSLLNYDRKTDPKVIDEKRKGYLNENKNTFQHLIDQIKKRQKPKPAMAVENDGELTLLSQKTEVDEADVTIIDDDSSSSNLLDDSTTDMFTLDEEEREKSEKEFVCNDDVKTLKQKETNGDINGTPTNSKSVTKTDDYKSKNGCNTSQTASFFNSPKQEKYPLYITPPEDRLSSAQKPLRQDNIPASFQSRNSLKKAECPTCQQLVPHAHINAHLDRCLELQSSSTRKRRCYDSDEDFKVDEDDQSETTNWKTTVQVKPREKRERVVKKNKGKK